MKKTIVCFGDSNTHGYCSETRGRFSEEERYPCLLSNLLGNEYSVKEEGLSGRTTCFEDPLHESMSGISAIYSCLMSHKPVHLLIIMLGTNDTKERFGATTQNIADGMYRLARKAISLADAFYNQVPNILIVAPPPINKRYKDTFIVGEMGQGCAKKSRKLAVRYKAVADLLNLHFLDAGSIDGICMAPEDYMHLTRESHKILANSLASKIPDFFHQ